MADLTDPGPIRDRINKGISDLFEFNQQVITILRSQAQDFETLAGFFDAQKRRAMMIHADILELAMVAAQNTGDILVSEFGIVLTSDDDEEDDDDEE